MEYHYYLYGLHVYMEERERERERERDFISFYDKDLVLLGGPYPLYDWSTDSMESWLGFTMKFVIDFLAVNFVLLYYFR